ncbi:hypothetical protein V1512DRAFT_219402 [Lipomyces arxii]|uniref:uncharacterized protein n=1 Tax=Lipomyces arxii TaxID=56418 RepID=UPI0034CFABF9
MHPAMYLVNSTRVRSLIITKTSLFSHFPSTVFTFRPYLTYLLPNIFKLTTRQLHHFIIYDTTILFFNHQQLESVNKMAELDHLKMKKDALVAALTQLSNAAQDASRACIDFYAAASIPGNAPTFVLPTAAAALLPAATVPVAAASAPAVLPVANDAPVPPAPKPEHNKRAQKAKAVAEKSAESALGVEPTSKKPAKDKKAKANSTAALAADNLSTEQHTEEPTDTETPAETTEEGGKKKRQSKRVIDPDAPRRPQTVYFAFANETRKQIREEHQARGVEASNVEIIREVAERWKNMTEADKEPWKVVYAEQIKKYDEEKAAYNLEKGIVEPEPTKKKQKVAAPVSVVSKPPATPSATPLSIPTTETPGSATEKSVHTPESTAKPPRKRKKSAVVDLSTVAEEKAFTTKADAEPKEKEKRKKKHKSEINASQVPSSQAGEENL